ncbi:MAG TPA: hypothetical protein VGR06_14885 [Actinophytocola sp.]|jgi:hypothetical protein|uniref:hypothetical protein n=1 Tax=Actinophytocola sp. TaxID=1872138 RepID=UPI002E06C635|nr:hypothetical protein [Actinophytocola sp.]
MRARVAALVLAPLVLLGVTACQDRSTGPSPLGPGPGATSTKQLDDMESTLDSIESELNDG